MLTLGSAPCLPPHRYYHHLASVLLGLWEEWPANHSNHFAEGSCFDSAQHNWNYVRADECMEDFQYKGTRLTMQWTRFGDEPSLAPLARLLEATVGSPDVVLASFGSWWGHSSKPYLGLRWKDNSLPGQYRLYERAVDSFLAFVERNVEYRRQVSPRLANPADPDSKTSLASYFVEAFRAPHLVWLGPSNCPNSNGRTSARTLTLFKVADAVVDERRRWHRFERSLLSGQSCARRKDDCGMGSEHPVGGTLNLQIEVLFRTLFSLLEAQPRAVTFLDGSKRKAAVE